MSDAEVEAPVERIEVPDEQAGTSVCFSGSPTIRINGWDVEPGSTPCQDCTPRCRLCPSPNLTSTGLRPLPEREWVERALRVARAG